MASLILGVTGLLITAVFSILATRAEQTLWGRCRRRESLRQMQLQISLGKARIR
jgi:hypothetical protein